MNAPRPANQSILSNALDSERQRTSLTAGFFALMILLLLAVAYLPGAWPAALSGPIRNLFWPFLVLFSGMMLYELVLRLRIGRLLAKSKLPNWLFCYANVLLETSVPSVMMLLLIMEMGPWQAMASATPMLYPLFIFMAALYLNFWVCVFSGVVAALQFLLIAVIYIGDEAPLAGLEMLTDPAAYLVKGALLLATGLLAGFFTLSLKRQMKQSVENAQQRDHAINVFGQHVSPEIAQRLLQQNLDSAGELREACVMFLDIRDFSRLAADKTPHEVMLYLNTLFGELIDVVNSHRGIVNKFLGDGFMAVFGAPADDEEKIPHALNAATDILDRVDALNRSGRIPFTQLGIGLHSGALVTGNVGTRERKEYTLIGETVNVAARIEQATKLFDAQLLVSEAILDNLQAPPAGAIDLGPVELRGQSKPVRLFQLR
ncbi:MAG: adenylate/guanylate cyclase domain-containing protein [Thiobacillus sp.]